MYAQFLKRTLPVTTESKTFTFQSALAAAKKGPEAFAQEFKKIESNANIREHYDKRLGYFDEPLIHRIITTVPDKHLPAFLNILIQHGANIETKDLLDRTPLSLAAYHLKKDAVDFLIKNKANINYQKNPPLCSVISAVNQNETVRLDIVKTLLSHGANINIQNFFSNSPLIIAAETSSFEIIKYLLSQNADLFIHGSQHKTAVGIAYSQYILAKKCYPEIHPYTQNTEKCLSAIVQAIAEYIYRQGIKIKDISRSRDQRTGWELFLIHSIEDLAGYFTTIHSESNRNALKYFLYKRINDILLARLDPITITTESVRAFCMGSHLTKAQREQKALIPPIYHFFKNDGRKDLTRQIFSYVYPNKTSVITSTLVDIMLSDSALYNNLICLSEVYNPQSNNQFILSKLEKQNDHEREYFKRILNISSTLLNESNHPIIILLHSMETNAHNRSIIKSYITPEIVKTYPRINEIFPQSIQELELEPQLLNRCIIQ